jgi:hypothetical protein
LSRASLTTTKRFVALTPGLLDFSDWISSKVHWIQWIGTGFYRSPFELK